MTAAGSGFGGHRLTQTIAPPLAYTPPGHAERILQGRSALEGERKYLTVLFADIRGSTAMIQGLDAEEAMRKLDPAVRTMMASIHRFEGTVNRVQGDGIMALFGAPLALEHHALAACYAGLHMQRAIAELGHADIAIRVGLDSGMVVVRSIGNDLSMNYDASGSTVHIAARMEQLAEIGKVRITENTFKLVEGFVEADSLGPVEVSGLSEPMNVYRLTGRQTARSRWQVRAAKGLTELIAREAELAAMREAMERAYPGRGQIVAVVGEAGVGKSRLVHEFLDDPALAAVTVVETSARPEGKQVPYLPISNLLRAWLGVDERDDAAQISHKLRDRSARLGEQLLAHLSAFEDLLDIEVADEIWNSLEPAERKPRIQRALTDLVLRIARNRPMLLVFEDLHWIDAETAAVIEAVAKSIASAKLMLLVTYRPEFQRAWDSDCDDRTLALDPLGAENAARLLDKLLGEHESLNALKGLLVARSQGTPLFMEELVSALKDSQALRRDGGRYVLNKQVDEIEMPATIQAVIASRIDRLPAAARDLLQVASVVGETVPESLLAHVTGVDRETLHGQLVELQNLGFLAERQIVPDVEYVFNHALTCQVAYGSMLRQRRRTIHEAVVQAIEARYGNRIDEHLARLAHHAEAAGLAAATVDYARRAGAKAFERSAYRDSIGYFDRALAALGELPSNRENLRRGVDLRLDLRAALGAIGNIARMHERLVEAEALARKLADQVRPDGLTDAEWSAETEAVQRQLAQVKIAQTFAFNFLGRPEDAVAAGGEGLRIAHEIGDPLLLLAGSYHLAQSHQWSGDFARVIELLSPQRERLMGPLRDKRIGTAGTTSVLWLGMLGAAQAYLGRFDDALGNVTTAREIAAELERPYDQAIANWYLGFVLSHQGRNAEAVPALDRAMAVCKGARIAFLVPVVATSQGHAYAMVGRREEAAPVFALAVDLFRRMGLSYGIAWSVCHLGALQLARGEHDSAEQQAREALELATSHGHKGVAVTARRLLAAALAELGEASLAGAEREARAALDGATALGLLPEVGHCHVTFSRISEMTGDTEAARSHADAARSLYDQLGMTPSNGDDLRE